MKKLKENKAFIIFYKIYFAVYLILCAAYLLSLVVNWNIESEYSDQFFLLTIGFIGLGRYMEDPSKYFKFFPKKSVFYSILALFFIIGFLGYFLEK